MKWTTSPDCAFCEILAGRAPAEILTHLDFALVIKPLNPVTEGHALVIPYGHVRDALESPSITGLTMTAACQYALQHRYVNLITSVGDLATQSVRHLHVHVIPRRMDDELMLPWGDNATQSADHRSASYDFYNGFSPEEHTR